MLCSIIDVTPSRLWTILKLRVRKDLLGEKGINSIPDNCEYTKKVVGLLCVLWVMDFVAYARINNYNEPLVCYYLIKFIAILSIPATISLLFGGSLLKYLRGESGKTSVGIIALMDISGAVSFVGRFAAQMVRYLFILVKMTLFLAVVEGTVHE